MAKKTLVLLLLALAPPYLSVLAQEASPNPSKARAPCLDHAHFADFDFWLGDWEVRTADGAIAGTNSITKAENGCVLLEKWRGSQGGSGMSMNYFDVTTEQWVQLWTGGGGSQIFMHGGLQESGMVLVGKLQYVGRPGSADFRGTWTVLPDGRIRQFFEQSTDAGETWTEWFEGFYSRIQEVEN